MLTLNGVGNKTAEQLQKIGIQTVQDLLFHLPLRYQDRSRLTPIGAALPGSECLVQGEIELAQIRFGRRRSLLCQISDGTGALMLRFFYFNQSQQNRLQRGRLIRCYGRISAYAGKTEMIHPEYSLLNEDEAEQLDENLIAVYPLTEGLQQNRLRKLAQQALTRLRQQPDQLIELIPAHLLQQYDLPDLQTALCYTHEPPVDANITQLLDGTHPAQRRLAFEELISLFLRLQRMRQQTRQYKSWSLQAGSELKQTMQSALTFSLTAAQTRVLGEIEADMQKQVPMMRLVQGDVGSGKTVVAALAAANAIAAGYKTAIMAPTELLAEQHYINFTTWFTDLDVPVLRLTGKSKKSERDAIHQALLSDTGLVIIGTHALFQKDVNFRQLGLVVIDEQHRFGVHQRLSLLEKGVAGEHYPHQLIMTATPIPRTLTMSAYADLDVSIIDELPPGRKPVNTAVIANSRRDDIIDRIRTAAEEKRQIYWVCTLIEESESLQCQAAMDTHKELAALLSGINVGLIHGRLTDKQKLEVMQQFRAGQITLLVATTVIEVGVDVPNASLMIIENAERLGLAQLHQLRGRIGRGSEHSDCVLLYQAPLSELSKARLETMRTTNDGFLIAEKDLQLRGPGDVAGTRQAGLPQLHIADLARHQSLLADAREAAAIIERDSPVQAEKLLQRWQKNNPLYGNV